LLLDFGLKPQDCAENLSVVDIRQKYLETEIQSVIDDIGFGLVGLARVKARVMEISMLLLLQRVRSSMGVGGPSSSGAHMSFTGGPGTGKTLVALRMASVLRRLGVVSRGHLVCVRRDDLVGQYIGHTAPKTRIVLDNAKGGILFIDEAYNLYKHNNVRDYGAEVVEILLQFMEGGASGVVLIFAGYKPQMDFFFKCNPGIASRILTHIDFPDYSTEELVQIGCLVCEEKQYVLSEDGQQALREYIEWRRELPYFANVRTVENKVAQAIFSQAKRLVSAAGEVDERVFLKRDLVTLTREDFERDR